MLFCDLDGTIIDEEGYIKRKIFLLLNFIDDKKYIITGRSVNSFFTIRNYDEICSMFEPIILCYNGNAAWDRINNNIVSINYIDASTMVSSLQKLNIDFVIDTGKNIWASSPKSRIKFATFNKIERNKVNYIIDGSLNQEHIYVIHVYCDKIDLRKVKAVCNECEFNFDFWPNSLIVYPSFTTKVNGVKYIKNNTEQKKNRIIVLGNDKNDIEIIKYSDLGIAVCPTDSEVALAADIVIDI